MRQYRKRYRGTSYKRKYPVTASTAITFDDLNGRRHRVNLDFDNPVHLYDFFDEVLGVDFTNQFKNELDWWLECVEEDVESDVYNRYKKQIDEAESKLANLPISSSKLTTADIENVVTDLHRLYSSLFSISDYIGGTNSDFDEVKQMFTDFYWSYDKFKDSKDFQKKLHKILKKLVSAIDESVAIHSRISDAQKDLTDIIYRLDV